MFFDVEYFDNNLTKDDHTEPTGDVSGISNELDEDDISVTFPPSYSTVTAETLEVLKQVVKDPVRCEPRLGEAASFGGRSNMVYSTHADSIRHTATCPKRRIIKKSKSAPVSVKFDKIEIREYPIHIGDNPSVTRGAPLTIDWTPMNHLEYNLEQYEEVRPPRRSAPELVTSALTRQTLLQQNGFSDKEIRQVSNEVNHARIGRIDTNAGLKHGHKPWEEFLESMQKCYARFMLRLKPGYKKRQKREEEALQYYLEIDKQKLFNRMNESTKKSVQCSCLAELLTFEAIKQCTAANDNYSDNDDLEPQIIAFTFM